MPTINNVEQLEAQGHPLTEQQRHTIRDGGLASQFINSPYWEALVGRMEHQCREALRSMYDCMSDDPRVVFSLWKDWKATERRRQDLENHFMALKDDYEAAQEEARLRHLQPQVPADDLSGSSEL